MLITKYHLLVNGKIISIFETRDAAEFEGRMYLSTGWNPDNIKIQKATYLIANVEE